MSVVYVVITVLCWGTWLVPSQNVRFSGQQVRVFYVAVANIVIAGVVAATQGLHLISAGDFALAFVGGLLWTLGGWAAFAATDKIGLVRAFGVWAPLNIVVSISFGAVLFGEFASLNKHTGLLLVCSLFLIIAGILMIIVSKGTSGSNTMGGAAVMGFLLAVAAGFLWAAYFLPIKVSKASMWISSFPLACGMLTGCLGIVGLTRANLRLSTPGAYVRAGASGALWSFGNFGMLLLVEALGAGKGFTISQLAVVVNAICGIYLLKDPAPGTRPARLALVGCVIATCGAIILGRLR